MKIRNGFVSNSSSSSFIIGAGKVTDIDKATKLLDKLRAELKLYKSEACIGTLDELAYDINIKVRNNILEIENFKTDIRYNIQDCPESQNYFLVDIVNNEGDYDENSALYKAVYKGCLFDREDFSCEQQQIFNINEDEHGIKDFEFRYGAARNG